MPEKVANRRFRLRVLIIPIAVGIAALTYFFVWPAIRERQAQSRVQENLRSLRDALDRYKAQHPADAAKQPQ